MWDSRNTKRESPQRPAPFASNEPEPVSSDDMHKNSEPTRYPATRGARPGALLSLSHRVKGEIAGNEDLLIEGAVDGLIQLGECRLTIGENARINADVLAGEVVVYGSIHGNLCASKIVEIKKNGSVVGEITTARIMIEDGAYIKGSIEIDRKGSPSGEGAEQSSPAGGAAIPIAKARSMSLQGGTGTLQMPVPIGAGSAEKKP
jgi:cytoskeletal protein CcmA (bactofilin family)